MKSLFTYLVDQVGGEKMLDPLTKRDALMELVDLYTNDALFFMVSK